MGSSKHKLRKDYIAVGLEGRTGELQKESVHFYKKLGYAQIEPFGEYSRSEYSLCFEKCLTS
ncbi:hypothetical protein J14TS5_66050 [Paenibacillus lautus]|uniref:hypothetical protein n=1 Tax=Paenibacillus lautus TaxID=1401 RepID=UPI001B13043E|nr:hypothetical protein [Paenibacillus lautus]GIP01520.1 hypothetical protein J14TS5_66050 [Paenibacillus lautus]